MSVHKYMHPRNIYLNQPNIELLVEKYPELKKTATLVRLEAFKSQP